MKRVGSAGAVEMDFPAYQLSDPTSQPVLGEISKRMADVNLLILIQFSIITLAVESK